MIVVKNLLFLKNYRQVNKWIIAEETFNES